MNNWLRKLTECILLETETGFRSSRGTKMKCHEHHQPFYIAFTELTKVFDFVSRELLGDILSIYGCHQKYIHILRLLNDDLRPTVLPDNVQCELLQVRCGVKQLFQLCSPFSLQH